MLRNKIINFMPQFDQFSFFNQVSWFLLYFFNFYFLITYFFLPKICYNLKFRKKKILFNIKKKQQIIFEKNNIIIFLNNSYQTFCSNFEFIFNKKLLIYTDNEKFKIIKKPIINVLLKNRIVLLLNNRFLLIKKIFILN